MGVLSRFKKTSPPVLEGPGYTNDGHRSPDMEKQGRSDDAPIKIFRLRIFAMVFVVSLGGLIFGYDTGQISGFLEMPDFLARFSDTTKNGEPAFSNVRSGLIVGLVSRSKTVRSRRKSD